MTLLVQIAWQGLLSLFPRDFGTQLLTVLSLSLYLLIHLYSKMFLDRSEQLVKYCALFNKFRYGRGIAEVNASCKGNMIGNGAPHNVLHQIINGVL
jgi:hypothetical protein